MNDHRISKYGRVISARVPLPVHDAITRLAATRGVSVNSLMRRTLLALSVAPLDGAKQLAAVAKALGLPPDASAADVSGALDALLAALGGNGGDDSPPSDPTADNAEGRPQALNQRQLALCRKHNVSPAKFAARLEHINSQWRRR